MLEEVPPAVLLRGERPELPEPHFPFKGASREASGGGAGPPFRWTGLPSPRPDRSARAHGDATQRAAKARGGDDHRGDHRGSVAAPRRGARRSLPPAPPLRATALFSAIPRQRNSSALFPCNYARLAAALLARTSFARAPDPRLFVRPIPWGGNPWRFWERR